MPGSSPAAGLPAVSYLVHNLSNNSWNCSSRQQSNMQDKISTFASSDLHQSAAVQGAQLPCRSCQWCQSHKSLSQNPFMIEPETCIATMVPHQHCCAPAGGASPARAGGHLACHAASSCCPAQPPVAGTALAEGRGCAGRWAAAHRAWLHSPDAVRPSGVSLGVARGGSGPKCLPQH